MKLDNGSQELKDLGNVGEGTGENERKEERGLECELGRTTSSGSSSRDRKVALDRPSSLARASARRPVRIDGTGVERVRCLSDVDGETLLAAEYDAGRTTDGPAC